MKYEKLKAKLNKLKNEKQTMCTCINKVSFFSFIYLTNIEG